ncbi:TPA: restriction endonuclease subunit S [Yersinia enterocolitica]|nr:restriction endonuclease subunit S [Yersinia enterocolitica]HEB9654186.1 restriction endonuclease subunit S [Yersinia enterocolitica]
MAKYKAYPEYKDSGVEWLGEIPKHWVCTVLKRLCSLTTGLTPPTNNEDNYADEGHPWVRPEDINENGMETRASKYVSNNGWKLLRNIEPNSTLLCCIGTIGKCGYVREIVSTNQQITAATFRNSERFNFYLMQSARTQLEELATGNVLKILNSERLGTLNVVKVEGKEADTIAAFLDHETAKIDKLIEKQQQLIELLKEKRQAVISHAVTKGLNPDVPMKDSGVEWLGEVPAHWKVAPLKHLCSLIKDGTHLPPPRVDKGVPLLSVRNIINGKFNFRDDDSQISYKDYKSLCSSFIPKKDDVLLAIVGATLGKVALVPEMESFHIQRSLGVFRTNELVQSQQLSYIFESKNFQNLLWGNVGFSAQPGIYLGTLANFSIPVPPINEQTKIIEFISNAVNKLDHLLAQTAQFTSLMQERRTALISAAVTGKIDVRDWVAPEAREVEVLQEVTA